MMKKVGIPDEISAIGTILTALDKLDSPTRIWVLESVISRLGIAGDIKMGWQNQTNIQSQIKDQKLSNINPKEFIKLKQPINDVQTVTCLAYFLTKYRDQPHFKSLDLTKLNGEAAGQKINMTRALDNAVRQSQYLATAEKGNKQISPLGDDVVEALPDQSKVKEIVVSRKKKRKRSKQKSSAKKKK